MNNMLASRLPQQGLVVSPDHNVYESEVGRFLYNSHEFATPWGNGQRTGWLTELKFLEQFARGIVVDVGANIGTHSVVYSKTAEHVYAFEPQQLVYYSLCANLFLNNVSNVTPFHLALGPRAGRVQVTALDPTQEQACAGGRVGMGDGEVSMIPLDTLELPRCHFIKIDVEGYETEVIRGMSSTLQRCRPIVFVEVHALELEEEVEGLMIQQGYRGNIAMTIQLIDPRDGSMTDIFLHSWLFLPNELTVVLPNGKVMVER